MKKEKTKVDKRPDGYTVFMSSRAGSDSIYSFTEPNGKESGWGFNSREEAHKYIDKLKNGKELHL